MRACVRTGLILVLLGLVGTNSVEAGWLGFRNDLNHLVAIQATWEVNGVVRRSVPHYLYPGEVTWDWTGDKGAKQITITDARPPKSVLYRFEATPTETKESIFVIRPAGKTNSGVHVTKSGGGDTMRSTGAKHAQKR